MYFGGGGKYLLQTHKDKWRTIRQEYEFQKRERKKSKHILKQKKKRHAKIFVSILKDQKNTYIMIDWQAFYKEEKETSYF